MGWGRRYAALTTKEGVGHVEFLSRVQARAGPSQRRGTERRARRRGRTGVAAAWLSADAAALAQGRAAARGTLPGRGARHARLRRQREATGGARRARGLLQAHHGQGSGRADGAFRPFGLARGGARSRRARGAPHGTRSTEASEELYLARRGGLPGSV